jgi:hypothetical protein
MSFLTKIEIIRALNLPDRVGRVKFAMWLKEPTFPKQEPGTAGRWWFPRVLQWVQRKNGVETAAAAPQIPDSSTGEGTFGEWRSKRKSGKAKAAGGPEDARAGVPGTGQSLGAHVVSPFRPREARLSEGDVPAVAAERDRPGAA